MCLICSGIFLTQKLFKLQQFLSSTIFCFPMFINDKICIYYIFSLSSPLFHAARVNYSHFPILSIFLST